MLNTFALHRPYSASHTLWLIVTGLTLVVVIGMVLALVVGIAVLTWLAMIVGGQ